MRKQKPAHTVKYEAGKCDRVFCLFVRFVLESSGGVLGAVE